MNADSKIRQLWKTINHERNKQNDKQKNITLIHDDKYILSPYHISDIINATCSQPSEVNTPEHKDQLEQQSFNYIPGFSTLKKSQKSHCH